MTSLDTLNAALDQGHTLTLLALADACEDEGKDDLAWAYRWLAEHKRFPARKGAIWFWRWPERDTDGWGDGWVCGPAFSYQLPNEAMKALKNRVGLIVGSTPGEFPSASAALLRGARAIAYVNRHFGPDALNDESPEPKEEDDCDGA